MKKIFFLLIALCFMLSACAAFQPQTPSPAPFINPDIPGTVAAQVQQTLQSLPTPTLAPSNTPVVMTATSAPTQTQPASSTPTVTQNTALLTLTATLGTGTVTLTVGPAGTLPFTATPSLNTPNPAFSATATETPHYQYYGTMPPNLPSGRIALANMSKVDAYISLQCTTSDGYVTIIEYPVGGSSVKIKAPAGSYVYVAWVGGKQFTGSFRLDKSQDRAIRMYKDRVEIK